MKRCKEWKPGFNTPQVQIVFSYCCPRCAVTIERKVDLCPQCGLWLNWTKYKSGDWDSKTKCKRKFLQNPPSYFENCVDGGKVTTFNKVSLSIHKEEDHGPWEGTEGQDRKSYFF